LVGRFAEKDVFIFVAKRQRRWIGLWIILYGTGQTYNLEQRGGQINPSGDVLQNQIKHTTYSRLTPAHENDWLALHRWSQYFWKRRLPPMFAQTPQRRIQISSGDRPSNPGRFRVAQLVAVAILGDNNRHTTPRCAYARFLSLNSLRKCAQIVFRCNQLTSRRKHALNYSLKKSLCVFATEWRYLSFL